MKDLLHRYRMATRHLQIAKTSPSIRTPKPRVCELKQKQKTNRKKTMCASRFILNTDTNYIKQVFGTITTNHRYRADHIDTG